MYYKHYLYKRKKLNDRGIKEKATWFWIIIRDVVGKIRGIKIRRKWMETNV